MTLADRVRRGGVVGAGGGGFPTHVKLAARADTVIANGAECEPLLHKDAAVLEHHAGRVVAGLLATMRSVGAARGIVALKAKNRHAIASVENARVGTPVEVRILGDYYPAGDEFDLVHEITGRLIPPVGLPVDVGCVVCNVETLANVSAAEEGRPVTHKTLTVGGAVRAPVTVTVPVGTPVRDCVGAAGGATTDDPVLLLGGVMMGELSDDLDTPVLKTTSGVVVLPRGHSLAIRKATSPASRTRIGRAACDQCRYCTEYCPRYLLGYAVEPHRVMRGLGFDLPGGEPGDPWAALCCACGLCTSYACPEGLFPTEACIDAKRASQKAGFRWKGPTPERPHPMRDGRRVPIGALMKRLGLSTFDHPAPWRDQAFDPARVLLRWKQHAGVPARPVVRVGDRVEEGQLVGDVAEGALGAHVHASIAGVVEGIDERGLAIRKG